MNNTAEQYRSEWAVKTGRSERDVYIPEALREQVEPTLDELRAALKASPVAVTQTFEEFILNQIQSGLDRRG